MQTRNTVIMAVLLVILAGFVYWYEIRGRVQREEAEQQAELLVHFDIEQVQRLELVTADGSVVASKSDGEWTILEPVAVAADGEAIDTLIDRLHRAKQDRQITEAAEDLSTFGLDSPVRVTLGLEDAESVTLALGTDTPVGFNLYAMPGDTTAVYSAPRSLRNSFDKKLFDLRDKAILRFEESDIERIEISGDRLTVSLRRQTDEAGEDAEWIAREPFEGRADGETIEDLLAALHTGKAEAFVLDSEPTDEQLAAYGLASPQVSITLGTADGSSRALLLGAAAQEPEGLYAMRQGGSAVFVVDADLLEDLPASADGLRNKQVLALARQRVQSIEVIRDGVTTRLERHDSDWSITAPRQIKADASAVSRLLSALQDLRAEGFADDGSKPQGTELTLRLVLEPESDSDDDHTGADERIELLVGPATQIVPLSAADEGGDTELIEARTVSASGDPTVYFVPSDDLEDLNVDLFDLRAKTLVQFTQPELTQIEIVAGDSSYELRRQDDTWQLVEPAESEVEEDAVSDLLWDLNYLRMEAVAAEWSGDEQPDLTIYGLAPPRLRLVARAGDEIVAELSIGALKSATADDETADRVYVTVGNQATVFEIGAALSDTLEALIDKLAAL